MCNKAWLTTNPTLLSKEQGNPEGIIKEITKIVEGPVSLEVITTEGKNIIKEACIINGYGTNVIVKVPMIHEGSKAVKKLKQEWIDTNVTLVLSANQDLLAAKAGASYVSPFIGRLDDICYEGMTLIHDIKQIFNNYDYDTKLLVASIRHPIHFIESGKIGADIVTLPPNILEKLISHHLTDKGLALFISDWQKKKKIQEAIRV